MSDNDSTSNERFLIIIAKNDDADGFNISETDLTTARGANEALMLISGGAGGNFAGIATGGQAEIEARIREEQEKDENLRIYTYMASNDAFSFFTSTSVGRELAQTLVNVAVTVAKVDADTLTGLQAAQLALDDGFIDAVTHENYEDTLKALQARVHAREQEIRTNAAEIEEQFDAALEGIKSMLRFSGADNPEAAAETITKFIELDKQLVTINIENADGLPFKVAVFKGDEEGQYYYISPETNERVEITDPSHLEIIDLQEKVGMLYGNDAGAGNLAEELTNIQTAFLSKISKSGLGSAYETTFNSMAATSLDLLNIQVATQEIEGLSGLLSRQIEDFQSGLDAGATPEELRANITRFRDAYLTSNRVYDNHYRTISDNLRMFKQGFGSMMDQLKELRDESAKMTETLRIAQRNNIADRDDQIRARFPDEWTPPEWMINMGSDGQVAWTARQFASAELKQAWQNVVQHEGKDVYRENETLNLYTLSEDGETRHYITDPATLARLNREAYGEPNADGSPSNDFKFFANETPYGVSKFDTFKESFIENTSHDRVEEAMRSNLERGEQRYGHGDEMPVRTRETGEDLLSSGLGPRFSTSARMGRQLTAGVVAERSGLDVDPVRGSFANQAGLNGETVVASFDPPSDDNVLDPDATPNSLG